MSAEHEQSIKSFLAERTGTSADDWFLVSKARYGMQVVFSQIQQSRGTGAVMTQLFTCATAVNPILAGNLTPIYGQVSADNISLDAHALSIPEDTRALVIQNTFGVIDARNAQELAELAHQSQAVVIEDSAHCVARMARDPQGQPIADVSVHSFGAEKILPTKFGGAIWLNPNSIVLNSGDLRTNLVNALESLPTPTAKTEFAMKSYRWQLRILSRVPGSVGKALRTRLAQWGVFESPIVPSETRGRQPHQPSRISQYAAGAARASLEQLDSIENQRSAAVAVYVRELNEAVQLPVAVTVDGQGQSAQPLVRMPVFVPEHIDAERVFSALAQHNVRPGRWYRPVLFPGAQDNAVYHYEPGATQHRATEQLVARVVNLPTNVSEAEALRIAQTLRTILADLN